MNPDRPAGPRPAEGPALSGRDAIEPTVLASRPLHEWSGMSREVIRTNAVVAGLMLGFVQDTAEARNDRPRLLEVIRDYAFRAFPNASHHVIVTREDDSGELRVLSARPRPGLKDGPVTVSHTMVERVLSEGVAVLYASGREEPDPSSSIVLSGMETAICAPLMGSRQPFGVLQMDIRRPSHGRFGRDDLDLLWVFASQVGLALEHLRMHEQERRAFESTINALLHSLTLKDPESARHSERVQAVATVLGHHLGLDDVELETLRVAALLHDLGKQGVRDEVLFKPERLTEAEREEMTRHAAHTQTILDKIVYPEELRDVPKVAAYHHEKLDGTGPFGVTGDEVPFASRILSVADVFDALMSPRVYKMPVPPQRVVTMLEQGKHADWDGRVVDALRATLPTILATIYPKNGEERERLRSAA